MCQGGGISKIGLERWVLFFSAGGKGCIGWQGAGAKAA